MTDMNSLIRRAARRGAPTPAEVEEAARREADDQRQAHLLSDLRADVAGKAEAEAAEHAERTSFDGGAVQVVPESMSPAERMSEAIRQGMAAATGRRGA